MRQKYSIIIKMLAFLLLFPFVLSGNSMAQTPTEDMKLFFVENRNSELKFRSDVDAVLWKLPEDLLLEKKEVEKLDELSVEEVEQKLGAPLQEGISNERGLWHLRELESPGTYYVRERGKEGQLVAVPTRFELPHEEGTIYIKAVLPEPPKGGRLFYKVDGNTQKPLGNAVFQVAVGRKDGGYDYVERDGRRYTVVSEKNGNLNVQDLPYGTYYLWEMEAPSGYRKGNQPIVFEISGKSEFEQPILIKNMPNIPPRIQIPKTGDLILYLIFLGGGLLVGLGYYISRKSSKNN